jgi:hypothetical protein
MLSKVTRALGYRYLWIDSSCILQDAYDDWDNDSNRMQEYYMNAILTIALDDTKGDHHGFLDRHRLSDENVFVVPFCSISGVDESEMLLPPAHIMNLCICLTREAPALAKVLVNIWPNVAGHSKKIYSLRVPFIMRIEDFVGIVKNIDSLRV